VNNRSLSRGDAVVIGAAALLFVFSFLDITEAPNMESGEMEGISFWSTDWFSLTPLASIHLTGAIGAGLIVGSRFMAQKDKQIAGMRLDQWGAGIAVTSVWSALWTMVSMPEGADTGVGLILSFFAAAALAGGAIATPLVPSLQQPLSSGKPAGGQPGMAGQQPYGQQPPGYGYPGGQQQAPQAAYAPTQAAPAQGGPDPNFQPFWFAVPAARPLYGEDGSPTPVAELAPGTWYLAVEQRGQALVAQTQDGRRGVLQDTSGIQRG
jgi:hypothetical protein